MIDKLKQLTKLDIYPASVHTVNNKTYFLGRRGAEKMVGLVGKGRISGQQAGKLDGQNVTIGPLSHDNAAIVRAALPWTAPQCIGLAKSIGLGDRLGLATPGHIRAVRGTGLAVILAQQSIREMTRTRRTPEQVMDAATFGVLQEGFTTGFGADADHLQKLEDIDATTAAGFKLFTIDPGLHVVNQADTLDSAELSERYIQLDFETFGLSPAQLQELYVGSRYKLADGSKLHFDEKTFLRAAVKYGQAITHTVKMFRRLGQVARSDFELEVSVDETDSPTSPAEHFLFALELKRLGVTWVAMAPRFIGRFEKGVDYIGDLDAFGRSFAQHVNIMRTLGPYKISIHSGSDKFSVYSIVAKLAGGLVHVKTAGTSYLEAVRAVAVIDPGLFREILDFARQRYDTDKATYHVSADISKVPPASSLEDSQLPGLLDDFHARQALHVTFGSVLTADEGRRFRDRLYAALERDEEEHYAAIERHIKRHIQPLIAP